MNPTELLQKSYDGRGKQRSEAYKIAEQATLGAVAHDDQIVGV